MKQRVFWISSRRCRAMLMLATSAITGTPWRSAQRQAARATSSSISISTTALTASAKMPSPCSSSSLSIASIFGRLEMEPTTSPVWSITASQMPMPSGTTDTYLVSTRRFCRFRSTSAPWAVLSTMLTKRVGMPALAISSATFLPTPPWTISTRPAFRPAGR